MAAMIQERLRAALRDLGMQENASGGLR